MAVAVVGSDVGSQKGSFAWWPWLAAAGIFLFSTGVVLYRAYGPLPCQQLRALFYMELDRVFLRVADVDICTQKVHKLVAVRGVDLLFREDLEKLGHFSIASLEQGMRVLVDMRTQLPPKAVVSFVMHPEYESAQNLEALRDALWHTPQVARPVFVLSKSTSTKPHRVSFEGLGQFLADTEQQEALFFVPLLWPRPLFL